MKKHGACAMRGRPGARFGLVVLVLLMGLSATAVADEALYQQARQLLADRQHEQAYRLLERESLVLAGEPEYDYLLGLAALRAGHPEQAMFALERVVLSQPNNAEARMKLVSTYLALGLDRQAQAQIEILEAQNPPPAARLELSRFHDILRPRLSGTPDPVHLVGLSAGHDSNVGSYPDVGLTLGSILLNVEPVTSPYAQLQGTIWHPIALSERQQLDFTLHSQVRNYREADARQFNLGLLHSGFLLNTTVDPINKLGVGLQANRLWLDGNTFRDHVGTNASWEHRLGAAFYGQLTARAYLFQFDDSANNYDQYGLGGELKKRWSPKFGTQLQIDLDQEAANSERRGGDAIRYQLGLSGDYRLNMHNQFRVQLAWSYVDYQTAYSGGTFYNTKSTAEERTDRIADAQVQWRHLLDRDWQLNTELTYRQQDSTLPFYDVDRWTAQLAVLRYF